MDIPGLRTLVAALYRNPSLTKLKLSGCKIYAAGAVGVYFTKYQRKLFSDHRYSALLRCIVNNVFVCMYVCMNECYIV